MANKKTCLRCGGVVGIGVRDTNRRYCSVECREAYWNEKRSKNVSRGEWIKRRYATPAMKVELNPVEASYVAGFMDGEGHIGIVKSVRKGNASGFRYRVMMEVGNTNKAVLERIHVLVGGNGWMSNAERNTQKFANAKPLYRLRFSRQQMAYLLPQLLPYFVVKRAVAEIALRFIALMEQAPMRTSRFHEQFEVLWQEARALNKRGIN